MEPGPGVAFLVLVLFLRTGEKLRGFLLFEVCESILTFADLLFAYLIYFCYLRLDVLSLLLSSMDIGDLDLLEWVPGVPLRLC